jgi:uncharacterized protein YndB with AHSA1/START domain
MNPWTHEYSCALPVPPARVFSALIEPLQLERWWAEHAEVEPRADDLVDDLWRLACGNLRSHLLGQQFEYSNWSRTRSW